MVKDVKLGNTLWDQHALHAIYIFLTRRRAIDHMMRGAFACMLPWRLGALQEFPPGIVEQAVFLQTVMFEERTEEWCSTWYRNAVFCACYRVGTLDN